MIMGDVPFSNEVEIVRAELNFPDDVSKGETKLSDYLQNGRCSARPWDSQLKGRKGLEYEGEINYREI